MFYLLSIIQFELNEIVIMVLVLLQNFLISAFCQFDLFYLSMYSCCDNPELLY